jgi:prepilin-type N-terminal cleavage/methylation domain-containing protein/prepilin-type processing-associated H-X9-DG protein
LAIIPVVRSGYFRVARRVILINSVRNAVNAPSRVVYSPAGVARSAFRRSGAFTLVELLTVLAIVAVLTALLIPAVGRVLHNARRAQAASNMRQIALAYSTYANTSGQPRVLTAATVYDWALALARDGGINEATLYFNGDDPLVAVSAVKRPMMVAFNDGSGNWSINPDFEAFPLSVSVVGGLAPDANPSTTPVAWSRGLQSDGTWSGPGAALPSAWNGEGGHVAFLDGHVEWFSDLRGEDGDGVLVNYVTKRPTANILEAINSTATVLSGTGHQGATAP